jgi:hypothetical protein
VFYLDESALLCRAEWVCGGYPRVHVLPLDGSICPCFTLFSISLMYSNDGNCSQSFVGQDTTAHTHLAFFPPIRYSQPKAANFRFKTELSHRDHHQCVISRKFDRREAERRLQQDGEGCRDDDREPLRNRSNDQFQFLEVTHILPHSLTSAASDNAELVGRLLLIMAALLRHCLERVEKKRFANSEYVRSRNHPSHRVPED